MIQVNPDDAHLTVTSDPFPRIIDGVPLRLHQINVEINRPGFMFNPTSCAAQQITSTITGEHVNDGEGNQSSALSSQFAAGDCGALAFAPSFTASTQGRTSKAGGASLTVRVAYPQGAEANIKYVKVDLPKQLPSRLTTLQRACVAAQFEANPAGCPAASVLGSATAVSPVLSVPLSGPAYFVSHGGAAFPDLEVVLQGEGVTVVLDGATFISKQGITSTTFASVPDAPISSFQITLPEGPHSALAANGNLCASNLVMPTTINAQNGRQIVQNTKVAVTGCEPVIEVLHHSVKNKTATIIARVPAAGKLLASGPGLSRAVKESSKATTVTLKLTLSKRERAFLARRHDRRRVTVHIKLLFTPRHGAKLSKTVTILIG